MMSETVVQMSATQSSELSIGTQSSQSQPMAQSAIEPNQSYGRQNAQICIGQQVAPIDVSSSEQSVDQSAASSLANSLANSVANVAISGTIISQSPNSMQSPLQNAHQNPMSSPSPIASVVSTSMPTSLASIVVSSGMTAQTCSTNQQMVTSHNMNNAINALNALNTLNTTSIASNGQPVGQAMGQPVGQTVHIHQSPQHAPMLNTSVQSQSSATLGHQMSVAMSQLPQVQVIQQPIGATAGAYQFQQVYQPQMLLPGNLTLQSFGAANAGLSLQIPFTAANAVSAGMTGVPITSISAKPPIVTKGVAISPLTPGMAGHGQTQHMLASLRPNMNTGGAPQILKQVLPTQQFVPHSTNQTVVISQILPQQTHHSMHPSILPATANRAILDANRGKPFGMGSIRSSFPNKMLSHSGSIQPKSSPILPASSPLSTPLIANSHFKSPFQTSGNTQLIATQTTPAGLITNQPQILGSFQTLPQGLTWTTAPHSAHLVAQNGSPIFIRTPTQSGEHMFIQTSNPQIQTVSMTTPINVGNTGSMQVTAQSAPLSATPIAQPLQQSIPVVSSQTTPTTTVASLPQPAPIAPAPIAPNASKARVLRPASSVATQTAASAIAQTQKHSDATTPPKLIAPAKPKSNQVSQSANKSTVKEHVAPTRSTSAATTQTNSQQTHAQNTKSDAANQTNKVSVGTETAKISSQVVSSRQANNNADQNKQTSIKNSITSSNTSTNTVETTVTQLKQNITEEGKPQKKCVEKKDASTGQDADMSSYFAQHHNQQLSHSTQSYSQTHSQTHSQPHSQPQSHPQSQVSSNIATQQTQQNGQIAVLSDLNRQDISKQPPQKAIVKPQILTHVIDGYIIQESPNPFPVNGLTFSDHKSNEDKNFSVISSENVKVSKNSKNENTSNASSSRIRSASETQNCQNCGTKRKSTKSNKKSKKYCNSSCDEKNKNNMDKNSALNHLGLFNSVTSHLEAQQRTQDLPIDVPLNDNEKSNYEEKKKVKSVKKSHENSNDWNSSKNGDINVNSSQKKTSSELILTPLAESKSEQIGQHLESQVSKVVEETATSSSIAGIYIPPGGKNPLKWSVQDVYEFVRNLYGCTEYADEFRMQEIDGQALMLLKEDHLMSIMNMKLGPALKICNKINALKDDVQKQN